MNATMLQSLARKYDTPLYVYDAEVIRKKYSIIHNAIPFHKKRIYYAIKANGNVHLLRLLRKCGAFADTFSPGEVFLSLKAGFSPQQIIFSGTNASEKDLRYVAGKGVTVNMDSLSEIERYAKMKSKEEISLRVNTLIGAGHHRRVVTGGHESKFGIHISQMGEARRLCKRLGLKVVGLHSHIGSGILDKEVLLKNARILLNLANEFCDVKCVDFGGGFGISYTGKGKFDIGGFGRRLTCLVEKYSSEYEREITLCIEPGRFLVGESGLLVCRVTTVKRNPRRTFVGVDSGFNHFMRHLLYNSFHRIDVLPKRLGKMKADICGNLCESGDIFAYGLEVGGVREGDLVIIRDAGAYGFSMASRYNARLLPAEVLLDNKKSTLIRKRERFPALL